MNVYISTNFDFKKMDWTDIPAMFIGSEEIKQFNMFDSFDFALQTYMSQIVEKTGIKNCAIPNPKKLFQAMKFWLSKGECTFCFGVKQDATYKFISWLEVLCLIKQSKTMKSVVSGTVTSENDYASLELIITTPYIKIDLTNK